MFFAYAYRTEPLARPFGQNMLLNMVGVMHRVYDIIIYDSNYQEHDNNISILIKRAMTTNIQKD